MDQGPGVMYTLCGGICFAPLIMFVVGMYVGRHGLPWIVQISRRGNDNYGVDIDD